MSAMQRRKGKVFERWFARTLRERYGDPAKEDGGVRRGIQSRGGGAEAADVVCDALPKFHFELSHGRNPSVRAKLVQAETDIFARGDGRIAVAIVKFDRDEPIAAMRLSEFLELLDAFSGVDRERGRSEESSKEDAAID